jgi:AcrR family transcriptional regulator
VVDGTGRLLGGRPRGRLASVLIQLRAAGCSWLQGGSSRATAEPKADTGGLAASRRTSAQTHDHILRVAGELFYREGIRATGIDRVVSQAEVAPTTLYRLFASKDELVAAYVEGCSTNYRTRLTSVSSPSAGTPRERILAVFDAFTDEVLSETCRGCPFLMVLAEFPDPQNVAHSNAVAHKSWLRYLFHGLVDELAREANIADPPALAEQLALVAEGIYGSVQSLGATGPAKQGRACVEALIGCAVVPKETTPNRSRRRPRTS